MTNDQQMDTDQSKRGNMTKDQQMNTDQSTEIYDKRPADERDGRPNGQRQKRRQRTISSKGANGKRLATADKAANDQTANTNQPMEQTANDRTANTDQPMEQTANNQTANTDQPMGQTATMISQ